MIDGMDQVATGYMELIDLRNKFDSLQKQVDYMQITCQELARVLAALRRFREEATETSMSQEDFDARLVELLFGNS